MNQLPVKAIQTLQASLHDFISEFLTEETYDGKAPLIDFLRHQLTGAEFASVAFPTNIQLENTVEVFKEVSAKIVKK